MKKATHKPARQTMKAPDMFRDGFQTFDKKTGERLNYGNDPEIFDIFQYETLIELPKEDPRQTELEF